MKISVLGVIYSLLAIISILGGCKNHEKEPCQDPIVIEYQVKALELMSDMKDDSALIFLSKAIEIDSNCYSTYANMISIYLRQKQFDEAVQASNKMLEIKPDLAEGWTFTGMIYDSQGDSITATIYYKRSIELFNDRINDSKKKNDLTSNRLNRAIALILLGQKKEGKAELLKLKSENPEHKMFDELLNLNKGDYIKEMILQESTSQAIVQ